MSLLRYFVITSFCLSVFLTLNVQALFPVERH